jgi:hypothetical protein
MSSALRSVLALASIAGSTASAATLVADYQFHNNYASSVPGAADLAPISSVSFTTATINGQVTDVAAFTQRSGVSMVAPGNLSAGYSLIVQVALDQTSGYRKYVDYSDLVNDSGLYVLNGQLDFYPVAAGPAPTITPSNFAQIALTRDGSGVVTGYVDGVQQLAFTDASSYALPATNAITFFVDDAHTAGNESSAGRVARIRLYSGVLTAAEIATLTGACYANCDGSTTSPVLNVLDFQCFLNRFAAGDSYANCDGSTTPPILNVLDFSCFLNKFAAGCS